MSFADYSRYLDPAKVPRLSKDDCRMTLTDYPPFLERLLGVWGPLSRQPFNGITSGGEVEEGLFSYRPDGANVAGAASAADRWLKSLDPALRASVNFAVDSDLWRHWNNTPLILREPQIELLELTADQRAGAMEVVRASLSRQGFDRTQTVMKNNLFMGQLIAMTDVLNDWAFTLSIFGEPSTDRPWGWQMFGHHLSLNCMFAGGQMILSPVFMGLEPDHEHGPENRRMFFEHESRALAFMNNLTDAERGQAVLHGSMLTADQPDDRYHPDDGRQVGGAFQDNRIVPYEGLGVAGLDRKGRQKLLSIAELFASNMPDGPFSAKMREIERYLDRTYFSWIGQVDDVNPFYFRIHSPVALIEFDHHSGIFLANENPERFHVHSIVRTPNGGDYGFDLLKQHYSAGGHDRPEDPSAHRHGRTEGYHSHDGGHTVHRHD